MTKGPVEFDDTIEVTPLTFALIKMIRSSMKGKPYLYTKLTDADIINLAMYTFAMAASSEGEHNRSAIECVKIAFIEIYGRDPLVAEEIVLWATLADKHGE